MARFAPEKSPNDVQKYYNVISTKGRNPLIHMQECYWGIPHPKRGSE